MDGRVVPVPNNSLHASEMDGELVILHADGETVVYCNGTAALVWRLCDGERSLDEMVALFAEAYPEAGEEMIRADVIEALRHLEQGGCLRLQPLAQEQTDERD